MTTPSAPGALAALLRPIAFDVPLRLTDVSAWVEHIPFALNLVELLRPSRIVELGTHAGDSYCALCQAVARLGLDSRCYAVDTWKGDAQSGTYGDEVLEELRRHHDPLYGSFSRLVRSTFDEAAAHFADGSIDLLHIDGFHTRDAVVHDFETWLPKLSPRAVVLFHDTNVREEEFGVWQLWADVAARYRWAFEFAHGHGLGVLAPGEPPDALRPLFAASAEESAAIRAVYSQLGGNVDRVRQLRAAVARAEDLARECSERAKMTTELRSIGDEKDRAIEALQREAARVRDGARAEGEQLRAAVSGAHAELSKARDDIAELRRELARAERTHEEQLAATQRQLTAAERELAAARRDLAAITGSKAWRVVATYRDARDGLLRRRR